MQIWALRHLRASCPRVLLSFAIVVVMVASNVLPARAIGGLTGTLSGRVTDDVGAPAAAVTVAAVSPSGSYRTTTAGDGSFSITGVVVDTYTVSFTKQGFEPLSQSGITVTGDQTTGVGTVRITHSLRTIGRVTARSQNGAFQPTQTQDSFTFTGQRVTEAQGKAFNTNQTSLIAASPGVQVDNLGNLSIRGSLTTEIGLNLDGVDYTSVDHGGAVQTYLNGIGSLSVNPGSGDATQGNSGAGVVNLIPKRGTRPPFGALDLETDTNYFRAQFGGEFGFATPNGRISNYLAFAGTDRAYPYGPFGLSLAQAGPNLGQAANFPSDYLTTQQGFRWDRDFLDNLVYRFGGGKNGGNLNQSFQFLYQTHADAYPFDVGGFHGFPYFSENQFGFGFDGPGFVCPAGTSCAGKNLLESVAPLYPGQKSPTDLVSQPSSFNNIVQYFKLEYDNNFNASTYLATRLYHISQESLLFDPNGTAESFGGSRSPNADGGSRGGIITEISKQLDSHNLLTFSGKYEIARPIFSANDPFFGIFSTIGGGLVGRTDWVDFLTPANTNAPLTFGGGAGANDCPAINIGIPGGCWLYYLNTTPTINGKPNPDYHFFKNGVPRLPSNILTSPFSPQDIWALALRDQITATPRLHLDLGVRLDAENNHMPNGLATGNVGPDNMTNFPRVIEPRAAFAFQLTNNDALRGSYGRSVVFQTGGTLFTPIDYPLYLSLFPHNAGSLPGQNIPGTDFAMNPLPNVAAGGKGCGSGEFGNPIPYRPCTSYADLIRWEEDYFAPDNGNARPTTYNNFDFTFSHQFRNGFSTRLTPFYKQGYDVSFFGLAAFKVDPNTGAIIPESFRPFYTGFSKQTGVEVFATTADRPSGLTGFLSATYVNSIANRPAGLPAEDSQPLVPFSAELAGNVYRSGYDSPLVIRTGFQYKTRNGFRVNPVLTWDRGYPIGVGLLAPTIINGIATNVPSTNLGGFGSGSVPVQNATAAIAYNYVDPTNPGTILHPNIYANRGTAETSSPGGVLSKPRLYGDLTLEYQKDRVTYGVQIINLTNDYWSEPFFNQRYQPIANGVAGPLSGQSAASVGLPSIYGVANYNSLQHAFEPYNLFPSNQPLTLRTYIQLAL